MQRSTCVARRIITNCISKRPASRPLTWHDSNSQVTMCWQASDARVPRPSILGRSCRYCTKNRSAHRVIRIPQISGRISASNLVMYFDTCWSCWYLVYVVALFLFRRRRAGQFKIVNNMIWLSDQLTKLTSRRWCVRRFLWNINIKILICLLITTRRNNLLSTSRTGIILSRTEAVAEITSWEIICGLRLQTKNALWFSQLIDFIVASNLRLSNPPRSTRGCY